MYLAKGSMRFPESERVIYDENPLERVICQLRFPPILRIGAETPATFQEQIRSDYPLLRERPFSEIGLTIPPEISKIFGEEVLSGFHSGKAVYDFTSGDENWTISLTKDFIALTSRRYTHWGEFKDRFNKAVEAFQEIYSPAHYMRVGLRYRDLIRRSKLGLKDVDWMKLLAPHIAGELSDSSLSNFIRTTKSELLIELEAGQGHVQIRHGLVHQTEPDEQCYLIDSDFFSDQKTEVGDAGDKLNHFNREAGRLFKWCITPKLHEAMGPHPAGT